MVPARDVVLHLDDLTAQAVDRSVLRPRCRPAMAESSHRIIDGLAPRRISMGLLPDHLPLRKLLKHTGAYLEATGLEVR